MVALPVGVRLGRSRWRWRAAAAVEPVEQHGFSHGQQAAFGRPGGFIVLHRAGMGVGASRGVDVVRQSLEIAIKSGSSRNAGAEEVGVMRAC